ncbi:MAG: hypothetical protein HND53_10370 [Proteobacteria bacterium]|nr:hypothetical protein [Pseudomonadota bacterium]NOG60895.1 hypothetical protein [Pseudomonadota bacterium]
MPTSKSILGHLLTNTRIIISTIIQTSITTKTISIKIINTTSITIHHIHIAAIIINSLIEIKSIITRATGINQNNITIIVITILMPLIITIGNIEKLTNKGLKMDTNKEKGITSWEINYQYLLII